MPIDQKLALSINQVLECLPIIISDIEQRRDYAKQPKLVADVGCLNEFKRQMMLVNDAASPSSAELAALRNTTVNTILPMLENLVSANLEMSQMGPLNLNRTIEPKDALAQNVKLLVLQQTCQSLTVGLAESGDSPSESGESLSAIDWEILDDLLEDPQNF